MPKRVQGRFNTSIPELTAKVRNIMVLLEGYPPPRPPCFAPRPYPPYVEEKVGELEAAKQVYEARNESNGFELATGIYRTRRELKTTLAYVVCYGEQILRSLNHLERWPGFNAARNPGGGPESVRRVKCPERQDSSSDSAEID
jgi:hypothetical protein